METIHLKSIGALEYLRQVLSETKAWSFDVETTIEKELIRQSPPHPDEHEVLFPYLEKLRKMRKHKKKEEHELREIVRADRRIALLKSDLRLHPQKADLFCLSIYTPDKVYYLEVDDFPHNQKGLKEALNDIFSLSSIKLVFRATFDVNVLYRYGVMVKTPIWCTKTMACVHNENDVIIKGDQIVSRYSLKPLAKKYLKAEAPDIGMREVDISEVSPEDRLKYCGTDSEWCYKLAKKFFKDMKKEKLFKVWKIEKNATPVFVEIEREGVRIDKEYIQKGLSKLNRKKAKLEKKIHRLAGKKFLITSSQQLAKVLFEDLGLPPDKRTKTGYSTDKSVLKKLKKKHKVIPLILKYKSMDKVRSTYLEPYLELEYNGRLYFNLNAWGARTGRTSSSNPNFGQLPKVGKDWTQIPKKAILPDEGHVFISMDRSQVEFRFLGGLSGDNKIIRAYEKDPKTDFHRLVAKDLCGSKWDIMSEEEKSEAREKKGKRGNFATVYGQSVKAQAELFGKTEAAIEKFQARYFRKYPRIKSLKDKTFRFLRKHEYVVSYFGRRRRLPEINSRKWGAKDHAERQGFNFIIQSPASADLTKMDMYNVDKHIKKKYAGKARIVLTVYDELLISAHKSIAKKLAREVKQIMEGAIDFPIPLLVDTKIKRRWGGKGLEIT